MPEPNQQSQGAAFRMAGGPGGGGGGPHAYLFKEKAKLTNPKGTAGRILAYLGGRRRSLLIVFLFATVATAVSILGTRLNGFAIDRYIVSGDMRGLGLICLVMAGIYLVGSLCTFLQNAIMIRVAQRSSSDIRRDLFSRMQRLPLRYFDTRSSGDLMSRLTNDVDNINTMLAQGVVQIFAGAITVVGMLAAMLFLSPILTAAAVAMVPLMVLGPRYLARLTQPAFVTQQRELGNLNSYIEETISGLRTVALFGKEGRARSDLSDINARYVKSSSRAQGVSGVMGPINNAVNNLGYLVIAVIGGLLAATGRGMTVGVVFSFLLFMRGFTRPINEILNLFSSIQSALAGAERVFEVIDEKPEADEPGASDIDSISGDVAIENLFFSYQAGKPVLRGADIAAKSGQTVAIVGPTGAGKTTVMNLLPKFYDFDSGSITIDGRSIREITSSSLRARVSIVLQDPFLYSASVRDNIRCGRLDASDDEIEEAARRARAHEFIMQLPNGYGTVLSDNGGDLSLGQRQLLSIARAVIARSSILILDEATSSIDTRTELLIQEALLELMAGKTSFVIAHRLSTIRKADKIVVIDAGRVVETGSHESLMASGGFYAKLYESQFTTGMPI
jgi:ATP-binding cassette, subfamily B, multidrug efflux pump